MSIKTDVCTEHLSIQTLVCFNRISIFKLAIYINSFVYFLLYRDNSERVRKRRRTNSWEETGDQLISTSENIQSQFGYDKKKTLSEICDARGDLWVHEKCATWTAATANSEEKLSVTSLVGKAIATVRKVSGEVQVVPLRSSIKAY